MEQASVLSNKNEWVTLSRVGSAIIAVSDNETRELMRVARDVYRHAFIPIFDGAKAMGSFVGLNVEHSNKGKERDYIAVLSAQSVVAHTQVYVSALGGIYNMGDGVWVVPTWFRDAPESFVRGFGAREWHIDLEQYIVSAFSYNGLLYLSMYRGSVYVINAQGKIVTHVESQYPKGLSVPRVHGRVYVNEEGVCVETHSHGFRFDPATGALVKQMW
jgi:hypothetical protein